MTLSFSKKYRTVVVIVFTFCSDDMSSNPAEVYNVSEKLFLKRTKMNFKKTWLAYLKS